MVPKEEVAGSMTSVEGEGDRKLVHFTYCARKRASRCSFTATQSHSLPEHAGILWIV